MCLDVREGAEFDAANRRGTTSECLCCLNLEKHNNSNYLQGFMSPEVTAGNRIWWSGKRGAKEGKKKSQQKVFKLKLDKFSYRRVLGLYIGDAFFG
jgi:hypothetical protein